MNWLAISDVTRSVCLGCWSLVVAACAPGAWRYMTGRAPQRWDALRTNSLAIGLSFLGFICASLWFRSTVRLMPPAELSVRSGLYVYASLAAVHRFTTVRAYQRDSGPR